MSQPVPAAEPSRVVRFGVFELDSRTGELRKAGLRITLQDQPQQVLSMLTEHPGELVTREDLKHRLWPGDTFVDFEQGLNAAVKRLRYVLGDSADTPRFIETLPRRGYRFIGPVDGVGRIRAPVPASPTRHRLAVAVAAAATSLLVAGVLWTRSRTSVPVGRTTVAVLPFEHLGGEPESEYLTDGLTEETSALLGQMDPEHIDVIGRTSTRAYKGTKKPFAEIGRELGAAYLVEGSVRAESRRLRVTSKLIRVRDQVQMWSASYDTESASMLEMQREVSTAIAEQIRRRLSPDRVTTPARRHTRDAEAYDLYLHGRYFSNHFTAATTKRAIEYYSRATEIDPTYALAWSGLADAYSWGPISGDAPPLTVGPRARDAAERAVRAEPGLAEAQVSLGYVRFFVDWDWAGAEAAFRRGMALDPANGLGDLGLGMTLSYMGRHEDARLAFRRARDLDPLSPTSYTLSAGAAIRARDFPGALQLARHCAVIDPQFWPCQAHLGRVYDRFEQRDKALEALDRAVRLSGNNSRAIALRGYVLARAGRSAEAREVLNTLAALSRERYVPPYATALVHAGLGDADSAFQWLERAYQVRDIHMIELPAAPMWDPYRGDPRFRSLLARCAFVAPPKVDSASR